MSNKGKNFSGNTNKNRPSSDFYQTPPSMVEQLLEVEDFKGSILEPCCGKFSISNVLESKFKNVTKYDLDTGTDFLKETRRFDNIITNPPFRLAKEFILKAFEITNDKVAMLLPLNYLHGLERFEKIYSQKHLDKVYVFLRYPMLTQEVRPDGKYSTGMQVYAWFIFRPNKVCIPKINWINNQKYILSSKNI